MSNTNTYNSSIAELDSILLGQKIHFNHYGNSKMPFACLSAKGISQTFIKIDGENIGETFEVLDVSGGYGSACLGASHPVPKQALIRAVDNVGYVTDEIASKERSQLLVNLLGPNGLWNQYFPESSYHVSGRNSGSEGMELALRLILESRFDTRNLKYKPGLEERNTILAFEGAWHGWTSGLVPLLNRRHYRIGLPNTSTSEPYGVKIDHIPFGDSKVLEEYFQEKKDQLLAVIVEPIQGDAGIIIPPEGYLRHLSGLCQSNETLLVADEVLTFAKTGKYFAMNDKEGHIPTDITVIGKSLGMGVLSTSMVIARKDLTIRSSGGVSTSDLRPITCAVINDGIQFVEEAKLLSNAIELGEYIKQLSAELVLKFPDVYQEARGIGVMHGIELTEKSTAKLAELRNCIIRNGVYVEFMAGAGRRSHGKRYIYPTMRIAPALISTKQEIQTVFERLSTASKEFEGVII